MPGENRVATFLLCHLYGMAQRWKTVRGQEKIPPNLVPAGSNRYREAFYSDRNGALRSGRGELGLGRPL